MSETVKRQIIYSYKGPIVYETIGNMISSLKERMSEFEVKLVVYKKILLILIESMENIYKYSELFEKNSLLADEYSPQFILERANGKFYITTSNALLNKDIPFLEERINYLNNLNGEGLKELYKTTITNGQFTSKGGAGLGFIEMAKIANNKIRFHFEKIDKNHSYFHLKININEENGD